MPIQIEHLTHTYLPGSPFSATAIHDITLTIEDGEFIGVLGHTGSGKTTLVQHLNGLLKPTEGRVVVDGTDITQKGVSLLNIRKQVGLVFQYPEYQLFEETVAKDVAFGPKNMGLTKEEIDERVRWAIAQVGLDYAAVAASSPFELSGGQMRRVAIAGVLAMRPKTLILDEPTAGLDPRGRRAILDMIRRLHAENSMTVIMVSHNMDDIATLATRLVVMGKGELRMTGTPREVFKHRDELRAIGLGVPQGAELCHRLRALGFAIPEGLYLLPEVLDAILTLAGKAAPSGASEPVAAMLAQALAMPGPDALEGAAAPPDAGDAQPDGASPAAERGRA
jgi:energy-coupling factor transport system ATP-binding protein